jgi:hypothetical protein
MLIEIDGRRYPVKRIEDLELRHIAALQHELASEDLRRVTSLRTLAEIEKALAAWGSLKPAERKLSPEGLFLTCFTVWAARVLAGESLTLVEAISVPAKSLRMIEEPGDRQAGEGQGKARKRPSGSGGARRHGAKRRK